MSAPMAFTIRCVPPSATAQQKGYNPATRQYYHSTKLKMQEHTWSVLLRPFVPTAPMTGPVELVVRMVYPHNNGTKTIDRVYLLWKETRPDADNAAKHLIDLLSRMRFIENDAQVARLIVEKFHGPEPSVGIRIAIQPLPSKLLGVL